MTRQIENRLVHEYVLEAYPTSLTWKRERLGPLPDTELANLYKVRNVYADVIVLEDNHFIIVEAKMRPNVTGVGQLEYYKEMLPLTPKFKKYKNYPIRLEFLTSLLDRKVKEFVEGKGIKYTVFAPAWTRDYWIERTGKPTG